MAVQFPEFMDKVVLITGGGRGIGRAIAIAFGKEGANVVVNDTDYEAASSVVQGMKQFERESLAVKCDVSNSYEVSQMFDQIVKQFGTLHILVNNAGGMVAVGLMEETLEEDFDRIMDINLKGTFLCTKAAIPLMKENRYGKIINVSSTAATRISGPAGGDYAAAKTGMLSLTRTFAYELAPFGINVNAICPGRTTTPIVQMVGDADEHEEMLKRIPLGRYASPEDQANAVILLCCDRASYIVGQHVHVDGGLLLSWTDFETYKRRHKHRRIRK